jgi:uncharacterized protein (DUF58 family)
VLSTRGLVLAVGSACSAIAGLVYGVEEFVLLPISVGVLLAVGAISSWRRQRVSRQSLQLVVKVPVAEVTANQAAVVELTVTNLGRHRQPPVLVEDPEGHWSVSHPGLGDHSVAGGRHGPRSRRTTYPTPNSRGTNARGTDSRGTMAREPAPRRQDAFTEGWLVSAGTRRSRRERAQDRRVVSRSRSLPDLEPGEEAVISIAVPTAARGLLTLSDVGLWCEDPFHLVARRITMAAPAHLIVYPVPAQTSPADRATGPHPGNRQWSGAGASTNAMSGDELSGLRPYAPGDRLTRLHWPALARSGELVVREFVEPQAGSLSLLVDVRSAAHTAESIEDTISRAAGLGVDALERGLTVELCASTGDRVVIAPNAVGRQTLLRALALLGPADAPPAVVRRWGDRPTGGAVWATSNLRGADVVLVTAAADAAQGTVPKSGGHLAETTLVR